MQLTIDDVCPSNLEHFKYVDAIKKRIPSLKVIAFVIANFNEEEDILRSYEFYEWWKPRQCWVEIGVHGYDHRFDDLQEGWRQDQKEYIKKAKTLLEFHLPERPLYRPPGFRFLNKTEGILKDLGFAGIAHQGFIKYFDTGEIIETIDTHCTFNEFHNPIGMIWQNLTKKLM
jgi:predicted deacetylase